MSEPKTNDPELGLLLREFVESGVLKAGSAETQVLEKVIGQGLASLGPAERALFERSLLPILAKPLREQQAVARILAKGGRVPRRITP